MSQKLTPCLWIDQIEEAANYYAEVFKSKGEVTARLPDGKPLTAHVDILGTTFMILGDSRDWTFNESVSFMIDCKDQAEVDYYWEQLTADGGEESMCGWLKDKFGLSWQIVPEALGRLIGGPDKAGAGRAMQAMLQMRKIIVADLEKAYAG